MNTAEPQFSKHRYNKSSNITKLIFAVSMYPIIKNIGYNEHVFVTDETSLNVQLYCHSLRF